MNKPNFIYILPEFANHKNLKNIRTQTQDEYNIKFLKNNLHIVLSETNSLIEDEYCLNLQSEKFILESEKKESMIHHHSKGHKGKHLQFKIYNKGQEIRIFLEQLNNEDYQNCIKGFLCIAKELIIQEQESNNIKQNLIDYFFNEKIMNLNNEKEYLLVKIKESFSSKKFLNNNNKPLVKKEVIELQKEPHLKLFLKLIK